MLTFTTLVIIGVVAAQAGPLIGPAVAWVRVRRAGG